MLTTVPFVTIGQTPRTDLVPDLASGLPEGIQICEAAGSTTPSPSVGTRAFGRAQQFFAEQLGFVVAGIFVIPACRSYFSAGLVPPVDRVFAATIAAGTSPELARTLLGWTAAASLIVRAILVRYWRERAEAPMCVAAGGFIAGAALVGFGMGAWKARQGMRLTRERTPASLLPLWHVATYPAWGVESRGSSVGGTDHPALRRKTKQQATGVR